MNTKQKAILILGIGLFLGIIFVLPRNPVQKTVAKQQLSEYQIKELRESIETLRSTGLITSFTPSMNEAFVNPFFWNQIEFNKKGSIANALATECSLHKNGGAKWIEIKDSKTGKKIAKFSEVSGFKVY